MDSNKIELIAKRAAAQTYQAVKKSLAQYAFNGAPPTQTYTLQQIANFIGRPGRDVNALKRAWRNLLRTQTPAVRAGIAYSMNNAGMARDFGVANVWDVLGTIDPQASAINRPSAAQSPSGATPSGNTAPATAPTPASTPRPTSEYIAPDMTSSEYNDPLSGLDGEVPEGVGVPYTGVPAKSSSRAIRMQKLAAKIQASLK